MLRVAIIILFHWFTDCYAQQVDTISIRSSLMETTSKCIVIKPAGYSKNKPLPVVYLLHGVDGKYDNWISKMPSLPNYATFFNILIVCPDGGTSGWYVNSPIDKTSQYETYIAYDVVNFIDKTYKTLPGRKYRSITGLSMGGHGAIMLAMKYAGSFGAAGSISGAMDLRKISTKYDLKKKLGDTAAFRGQWENYSVISITDTFRSKLKLIIDCGSTDIFIQENRRLHQKLMERSIPHDYIERDGGHSWEYWINALPYQLLFFRKYFDEL